MKKQTDREIKSAIEWYSTFYSNPKLPNTWKDYLKSLISTFEKNLLTDDTKINWFSIVKSIFAHILFHQKTTNIQAKPNTLYYWPFQFLHCDFGAPVIQELKKKNIPIKVFVFRENLVDYLKSKNIDAELLSFKRTLKGPVQILKSFFDTLSFFWILLWNKQKRKNKLNLLKGFIFLNLIRNVKAAIEQIAMQKSNQYHLVGYDMSVLGRIIIHHTNSLEIPNGRIQNGAANHLLSGYSEVKDVFLWDELSRNTYLENGFKGNCFVTGNILLFDKLKNKININWEKYLKNIQEEYKQVMFVAFSGPGHNTSINGHKNTVEYLEKIILHCKDNLFLIKLHPKDNFQYYKNLLELENVVFTDNIEEQIKPDALDCLFVSDLLITGASSIAFDAFQLGKHVISIDPLQELNHFNFRSNEMVLIINTNQDLEQGISFIYNYKLKKLAETEYLSIKPEPLVRICDIINSRINQNGK